MQENNFDSLEYTSLPQEETQEEALPPTDKQGPERAILMGIDLGLYDAERSMQELAALCEANNIETTAEILQKRQKRDVATVMGSGRVDEAKLVAQDTNATMAVFDGELTGSQIRNLEKKLEMPVIDRTMLILSIFSQRATTHEGKLQTELATLEYRLPRLAGHSAGLSRQGGGSGGARRGGGEQKLEYDRRYIRDRIAFLKKKIAETNERREENRRNRKKNGAPVVALVGYTNVGKSSLVNALTGSDIGAADMLFATLDPTARRLDLPDGQTAVLIDTVGFVSRLPHNLVDAFKSTLEEAAHADLLLVVCDAADPEAQSQLKVTAEVLADIGADDKPQIVVFNKSDIAPNLASMPVVGIAVSAKTGKGLASLQESICHALAERVAEVAVLLPYDKLSVAAILRAHGTVEKEEYQEDGVYLEGTIEKSKLHHFEAYLVSRD